MKSVLRNSSRFAVTRDILVVAGEHSANHIHGGQPCEYETASVKFDGRVAYYNRNPGESLSDFQARAFASTPRGRFARAFTPVLCEKQ